MVFACTAMPGADTVASAGRLTAADVAAKVLDGIRHRQLHVFGLPFYYIEYGIAQLGALQMWQQSRRHAPDALGSYKKGLALGASRPLPDLFKASGLNFSFGPDTMGELMQEVGGVLDKLPA